VVVLLVVAVLALRGRATAAGQELRIGLGASPLFLVIGVLVVVGGVVLLAFGQSQPQGRQVSYSGGAESFLGFVKQGRVDRVAQRGADLAITLVDGTALASRVPSEFSTNVREDIDAVCSQPDAHCAPGRPDVTAEEPSQTGQTLTLLLTSLLPVILIGSIFFFLTRQSRLGPGGRMGRPRPAKDRLAELEDLRSRGAITEEEYAAKRRQILDEL
jgi:hypothetical protein